MKEDFVVHVDSDDKVVGFVPKLEAHQKAILHRAISVLIFDSEGNWILQKRADDKYHSAGLWTNTCCSHPLPGEKVLEAAERRLQEEMGMSCFLEKLFAFEYRADFDNGLTEHELDHVFIGNSDKDPKINPSEASDWRKITTENLLQEINDTPEIYTEWFKIIVPKVIVQQSLKAG